MFSPLLTLLLALALVALGAWLALGLVPKRGPLVRPSRRVRMTPLVFGLLCSFAALADTTSGPINSLPRVDIVQDNGSPNAKGFSLDPQIGQAVTSSTGATAATTSFTVMKADTTFTALRGAIIGNTTNGTFTIARSGLYRVEAQCNGAAANGETSTIEAAYTTDDANYTQINGAQASFVALTGALTQGMHAAGYLAVTSGQASAGTLHVVARGKNSAGTLTCKSMSLLTVERVDQAQPAAYP